MIRGNPFSAIAGPVVQLFALLSAEPNILPHCRIETERSTRNQLGKRVTTRHRDA